MSKRQVYSAKQTRNSENHRKRVEDEKSKKPVRSILRKFSNGGSNKVKDIGHKLMKLNLFGNKPIPSKQGFNSTKAKEGDTAINNTDTEAKRSDLEHDALIELDPKLVRKLKAQSSIKQSKSGSTITEKKKKKYNRQGSVWIGPDGMQIGNGRGGSKTMKSDDNVRQKSFSSKVSENPKKIVSLAQMDGVFSIVLRAEVTHASLVDSEKKASFFQNNQPHVEYHIKVQSIVTVGEYESIDTWEITQRERVFFQLHRTLKSTYKMRISLPPKQIALFSAEKFDRRFLETRRVALNTYLNEVLAHPAASLSQYILAFLMSPIMYLNGNLYGRK